MTRNKCIEFKSLSGRSKVFSGHYFNDIPADSYLFNNTIAAELETATGNVIEKHINWNLTDLWFVGDLLKQTFNVFRKHSGARWRVEPEEISQHTPGSQRPQQNRIMLSFLRSLCKELS